MRALITGCAGQLGTELRLKCPAGIELTCCDRATLDITDGAAVSRIMASKRPDVIVNAAAYTAVDAAEDESGVVARVNGEGAGHVAAAAQAVGARLLHLSTDYVFDGTACTPYTTDAEPNPVSAYGRTKLEGERQVRRAAGDQAIIIRTSWVYSTHGRNFFNAMRTRMKEGQNLRIVADQVGTPTWAGSLAETLWKFAVSRALPAGLYHWTDAGVASWYDFAVAIMEECIPAGLLSRPVVITPIATSDYPTPATRPAYSVLDKSLAWSTLGEVSAHWRASLRRMLQEEADRGA